jgi:hypothetical protein
MARPGAGMDCYQRPRFPMAGTTGYKIFPSAEPQSFQARNPDT